MSETMEVYALDLDWDLILHLANPESVKELRSEILSPELIEDDLARSVFGFQIGHVRKHGEPATPSVLEDEFPDISLAKPETQIGDLIYRLRQRYLKNRGREIIRDVAKKAGEDPSAAGDELLRAGRTVNQIAMARGDSFGTGRLEQVREKYDKRATLPRASLGFKELDDHFAGIRGVTVGIAPPKTYKSWFCVNSVLQNLRNGGLPYLYSLELPAEDTDMRLRCMAANIPFWKWDRGCLDTLDWKAINKASDELDGLGVFKVEKPGPGDRSAHAMVDKALNDGATSIFIDQLQYIENDKGVNLGTLSDTGAYWEVLSILRDYSDDIPIFVVHQFNRSVMGAKEMPEMQQAKGSSAIEEIGHLVLGMWANKEMRQNNVVEIGTLASRTYNYKSWQMEVELSRGSKLTMLGETDEDE